jgi:hypothetical protein
MNEAKKLAAYKANKRFREKNRSRHLTVTGDVLDRYDESKNAESEKLGYKLSVLQFMTILLQNMDLSRERENNFIAASKAKAKDGGGF